MSFWNNANRWLEERPLLIYAAGAALLIFLWILALLSGRPISYAFAIIWTVIVLVIQPLKRRRSR